MEQTPKGHSPASRERVGDPRSYNVRAQQDLLELQETLLKWREALLKSQEALLNSSETLRKTGCLMRKLDGRDGV